MRIAIFTLTRDRLNYTKRMLKQLKETAGVEYDHYILDNGSQDGSFEWLNKQGLHMVVGSKMNMGLWRGIQYIIDFTRNFKGYDYVIKIDNDMEFPEKNWLKKLIEVYENSNFEVLSPFVEGVCDGKGGVERSDHKHIPNMFGKKGVTIGYVPHVGGACLLSKPEFYYEDLPNGFMATGWDTWFCEGLYCGIVEDIHVKHDSKKMEAENKEYHKRQVKEEKMKYED
jgi:glycosyltransferase involved in cell wall biosynthesis